MRKQTKLVAVLSAAALLAIGASMTSFAAAPRWDQQDNEWVYLDRNGDRVTDEWKKSNGQWYYLDENGYMAREVVIEDDDDKYYVGADGARVTNTWISLDNDDLLDDDDETDAIDTVWMYFDGTGKALGCDTPNGEIKRLTYGDNQTGYFIFNEDGYMLSGWKRWTRDSDNDELYYLGGQNEGWAHTGWQYLMIDPDIEAFSGINSEDDNYSDESYFYFKTNGKAVLNGTETVAGKTYAFDAFGRLLDLWVYKNEDGTYSNAMGTPSAPSAAYYKEGDGDRDKNWVYAYPTSDYDNYDDDPYWFYLTSKGAPFRADESVSGVSGVGAAYRIDDDNKDDDDEVKNNGKVVEKSIKGETYLFNDKGVMLTGLYWIGGDEEGETDEPVYKGKSTVTPGYYYFTIDGSHSSVEGQMVKNKRVTIDVDDEDETYYFKSNGQAYTSAIINGYVYGKDGKLASYGDGNTYATIRISELVDANSNGEYILTGKNGKEELKADSNIDILVNEKGKIRKSGTVEDVDGYKMKATNYVATPVN